MSAKAPPNPSPQRTDENDSVFEKIYEGEAPDSTDTNVRWAAYTSRVRTIMRTGHRYIAYTSDIGESFRPVSHPYIIRAAYGVSWLYLTGDVLHEGYKAYLSNQATLHGGHTTSSIPEFLRSSQSGTTSSYNSSAAVGDSKNRTQVAENNPLKGPNKTSLLFSTPNPSYPQKPRIVSPLSDEELELEDKEKVSIHPKGEIPFLEDYRTVMVQRAIFQGLASMGLPAFTIHSVVKYSGRALKDTKSPFIRTWGPVGLGLAIVPALPYMFDEPVEKSVEWIFEKGYETVTGKKGVSEHVKKEL